MIVRLCILFMTLFLSGSIYADDNFITRPPVKNFIHKMVKKHHFKEKELIALFKTVKMRPAVMKSINTPLESKPWYTYQMLFVTEWRIREGAEFWKKYQDALQKAEKKYGVPASIIVATIGVETKYGKNTGEYRVLDALSNIAFSDSKRAPYFLKELEEFLLLTKEQHLDPKKVLGSYAGAIGQPQFMPSSYRHYAINFSGNKHIDLNNNEIDVIGSIANYYKEHGWKKDEPVVIPASVRNNKFQFLGNNNPQLTFSQMDLAKYGISSTGKIFENKNVKVIELQGYFGKEYWLGFPNFDVIKRYNPSDLYAMAVYQLSHYINMLREKTNHA